MQRLFAIALVCGLVWVGVTVFTQGTEGLLRWLPGRESRAQAPGAAPPSSPLQDMRARGEEMRKQQLDRIERQLGPEADSD